MKFDFIFFVFIATPRNTLGRRGVVKKKKYHLI